MQPFSILGIFCEDIREELRDQYTIVGTVPDNVNFIGVPPDQAGPRSSQERLMSKICVFVRANFDPDDPIKSIQLRLVAPGGHNISIGGADTDLIAKAQSQAKEKGNLLAGVVLRIALGGLRLREAGDLRLEADLDNETRLIAALRFTLSTPEAPTAP